MCRPSGHVCSRPQVRAPCRVVYCAGIYLQMQARKLISVDGHITAWSMWQGKKEDDTAAECQRRKRERDREDTCEAALVRDEGCVTHHDWHPPHAVTPGHCREEESREEHLRDEAAASSSSPKASRRSGQLLNPGRWVFPSLTRQGAQVRTLHRPPVQ